VPEQLDRYGRRDDLPVGEDTRDALAERRGLGRLGTQELARAEVRKAVCAMQQLALRPFARAGPTEHEDNRVVGERGRGAQPRGAPDARRPECAAPRGNRKSERLRHDEQRRRQRPAPHRVAEPAATSSLMARLVREV